MLKDTTGTGERKEGRRGGRREGEEGGGKERREEGKREGRREGEEGGKEREERSCTKVFMHCVWFTYINYC